MTDISVSPVDAPVLGGDTGATVPEKPLVLTLEQVAEGFQLSVRSVLRMIERGELQKVTMGRLVRIPFSSFKAYADSHGIEVPDDFGTPRRTHTDD